MTWRKAFYDTYPVDTPYHFNLLVNATTFNVQTARFIYRSETSTMKQPTGSETTWMPPANLLTLATGRPATISEVVPGNGLPFSVKLGIGLGVPFGIVLILFAILVWLLRKRRAGDRIIHGSSSQVIPKGELDATTPKVPRRHELGVAESSPPGLLFPAASRAQVLGIAESLAPGHNSRRHEMHGNDGAAELA